MRIFRGYVVIRHEAQSYEPVGVEWRGPFENAKRLWPHMGVFIFRNPHQEFEIRRYRWPGGYWLPRRPRYVFWSTVAFLWIGPPFMVLSYKLGIAMQGWLT